MIGKIDTSMLKQIIRPAYKNYRNIDYDLSRAKNVLVHYIRLYFRDANFQLPISTDTYKLNKCTMPNKLRINIKGIEDLSFYASAKSGKIYLSY